MVSSRTGNQEVGDRTRGNAHWMGGPDHSLGVGVGVGEWEWGVKRG